MKKIFVLSILLSLVCTLQLSAQDIYEVKVSKNLNVRKLPSADATVVGSLANGTLVEVISIDDSWAEINYKNQKAYISAKYITLKAKVIKETTDEVIPDEAVEDSISTDDSPIVIETKKKRTKQRNKEKNKRYVATDSIISKSHSTSNKLNDWAFDFVPSVLSVFPVLQVIILLFRNVVGEPI